MERPFCRTTSEYTEMNPLLRGQLYATYSLNPLQPTVSQIHSSVELTVILSVKNSVKCRLCYTPNLLLVEFIQHIIEWCSENCPCVLVLARVDCIELWRKNYVPVAETTATVLKPDQSAATVKCTTSPKAAILTSPEATSASAAETASTAASLTSTQPATTIVPAAVTATAAMATATSGTWKAATGMEDF